MWFWLFSQIQSLIESLHSKDSPRQLALGAAIGSLGGWVPFNILYTPFIFLLLYLLNVNPGMGLLVMVLTSIFGFLLDPWAGLVGHWLLVDVDFIKPLWRMLFNIPVVPYTRFNNTVMLGSVIFALLLFFPVYFLTKWGVGRYRTKWKDDLEKMKIVKWLKHTKALGWLSRLMGQNG